MNTIIVKTYIILSRKENQLNIPESDLELEFDVLDNTRTRFANDAKIRLLNHGMVELFGQF